MGKIVVPSVECFGAQFAGQDLVDLMKYGNEF
jgi:hypothetical protein